MQDCRTRRWFLKILNRIGFIHMHFFADFTHSLCYTHLLTLTYLSFLRCPNSLAGMSCWGIADKGTLTSKFSSQILASPWLVIILCDFYSLYAQATLSSVVPLLLLCCRIRCVVTWRQSALYPTPVYFLLHWDSSLDLQLLYLLGLAPHTPFLKPYQLFHLVPLHTHAVICTACITV